MWHSTHRSRGEVGQATTAGTRPVGVVLRRSMPWHSRHFASYKARSAEGAGVGVMAGDAAECPRALRIALRLHQPDRLKPRQKGLSGRICPGWALEGCRWHAPHNVVSESAVNRSGPNGSRDPVPPSPAAPPVHVAGPGRDTARTTRSGSSIPRLAYRRHGQTSVSSGSVCTCGTASPPVDCRRA